MSPLVDHNVVELKQLRDQERVFANRRAAGEVLGQVLKRADCRPDLVLAIPAGGIEVGAPVARTLDTQLHVCPISKITPPWNTDIGYGAMAQDGTTVINNVLLHRLGLREQEVQAGLSRARRRVDALQDLLVGGNGKVDLAGRHVLLVDDGLASGYTLRCAIQSVAQRGGEKIAVAVPTGHAESMAGLVDQVEAIFCPNIRHGWSFAVADAYEDWSDVEAQDMVRALRDNGWEYVPAWREAGLKMHHKVV